MATEDSFEVADAGVRTAATDNRRLRLAGARNVAFAIPSTAAAPRTKAIAESQTRARAALQLLVGYLVSRRSPLRGWPGGPASRRGGRSPARGFAAHAFFHSVSSELAMSNGSDALQ
jgi:hypothetical protein